MEVKICGLTRVDQAVAIAQLGVTAIGVICVPSSSRYVAPRRQWELNQALAAYPVWRVGVFAQTPIAEVVATVQTAGFNVVQLHGDESPEDCQVLRAALPDRLLIKAIRVRDANSLGQMVTYIPWVDRVLLDAYHPHHFGGTGLPWDWQILTEQMPNWPWWLAGGVTPENCRGAIAQIQPDGIDVSSGVEIAPGVKDLARVAQLLQQLPGH